jgi:hypothetical protein
MATQLVFNVTTKKVKVTQSVSQDLYGVILNPSGVVFLTKNSAGNKLITSDVESAYFSLPLDTSGNIVYGTYILKYGTSVIDPNDPETYDTVSVTFTGANKINCATFAVEHNCDYYPTGLITATDSTYFGDNTGTANNPTIVSREITLYYPDGLENPTPDPNFVTETQSPVTPNAFSLTIDTLATGMWTAISTSELTYTQEDNLVIEYQLKKTLNHNVVCNSQLCNISSCVDKITQAYSEDIACGKATPRYAQQITLINAYYSQYQMERACGNTTSANEYVNKIYELVGGSSSCGCGCGGSCSSSCSDSCNCDDNSAQWINVPGSETQNVLEQMQDEITSLQGDITIIQNDITVIEGDITTIEGDITDIQQQIDDLLPTHFVAYVTQAGLIAPSFASIAFNNTSINYNTFTRIAKGHYTISDSTNPSTIIATQCPASGYDVVLNDATYGSYKYEVGANGDIILYTFHEDGTLADDIITTNHAVIMFQNFHV